MPRNRRGREGRSRAGRGRTKKLILAFHFQFSDRARWRCEPCRRAGLERERGCAWAGVGEAAAGRAVWARKGVVALRCPTSLITAESRRWLEEYRAWKTAGGGDYRTMSARQVDAFEVLEEAWATERTNRDE